MLLSLGLGTCPYAIPHASSIFVNVHSLGAQISREA